MTLHPPPPAVTSYHLMQIPLLSLLPLALISYYLTVIPLLPQPTPGIRFLQPPDVPRPVLAFRLPYLITPYRKHSNTDRKQ